MKFNFNTWDTPRNVYDSLRNIITNDDTNTFKNVNGDLWLYPDIGDSSERVGVLDFGCGVGRNSFALSLHSYAWSIVGYDNINMILNSQEYCQLKYRCSDVSFKNLEFECNWDAVKTKKFDCVLSVLCFQHIYESDLVTYLNDIRDLTNKMVVVGRRFNDDVDKDGNYKNTWKILESCGYIPDKLVGSADPSEYMSDGDPDEHFTCLYTW